MIALEFHPEGAVLSVRAQPGAKRNEIRGVQAGALKVSVTLAPEKGKANKGLIDLLSKSLGLRKSQIELLSGETSRSKKFLIRGITSAELSRRIEEVVAGT